MPTRPSQDTAGAQRTLARPNGSIAFDDAGQGRPIVMLPGWC
jgi:hypothetical protein